jgi:hypothetical protein
MTIQHIIFVILVFTSFFNCGVQAYIHFNAYPILKHVGRADFANYLTRYEQGLTVPLLLPYGLSLLSALLLIFLRPSGIDALWIILALVLNGAVAAVTMIMATPIYNRIKEAGEASPADMSQLINVNLLRLLLTLLSSVVVIWMLLVLIRG